MNYAKQNIYVGIHTGILFFTLCLHFQRINWDTDAFDDESKYWNQLVKLVAGERPIKPLNRALLDQKRNLCFKTIYFGVRSC